MRFRDHCSSVLAGTVLVALAMAGPTRTARAQTLLHTFPAGARSRALAFSADDRMLAGVGGGVAVWNLSNGQELARTPQLRTPAIAFTPDNLRVAMLDWPRGSISFWDFSADQMERIQVFDTESKRSLREVFAFSADGQRIAVAARLGPRENVIRVLQTSDGQTVADLKMAGFCRDIFFGDDDNTILAAEVRYLSREKRFAAFVQEWDVEQRKPRHKWGPFPVAGTRQNRKGKGLGMIRLSPDGRFLASTLPRRVFVFETATGRHETVGPHPSSAVLGETGKFFVESGTLLRALAFRPGGYALTTGAVGSSDARLWSLDRTSPNQTLPQPGLEAVRALKYSLSGRLLAVGGIHSDDGPLASRVHVWRLDE